MENKKDYIFHVNWDDANRKSHRIGILAKIDEMFYFSIKDERQAQRVYKRGFIGISGFKPGKMYMSDSMFDFFKNRVIEKTNENICEELAETRGESMIDSYSVDEITGKKTVERYKDLILKLYEIQLKQASIEKNNSKNSLKNKEQESQRVK